MTDFNIPAGVRSVEWDRYENDCTASDTYWGIAIEANVPRDVKWGVHGSLEREWSVELWPDGLRGGRRVREGSSADLNSAKRESLAALRELAAEEAGG